MTTLIATMLMLSAVCETFGTVTVWINYRSGADVAARLLAEVEDEDDQDRYVKEQYGINPALLIGNEVPYHELVAARANSSDPPRRRALAQTALVPHCGASGLHRGRPRRAGRRTGRALPLISNGRR